MKSACRIFLLLTMLLLLWQGSVLFFHLPDYLLPSPIAVFKTFYEQQQLLATHFLPTLSEIVFGLILGVLFGCFAGLSAACFRPFAMWFMPLLVITQTIPTFAIAPLIVLWFGYGLLSKVAITVLIIFFPITSAFYDGLRQTPAEWLDIAKNIQANRFRTFWYLRIPAALPSLASGIRISVVIAPLGAIVGEWVGSSRGLGYLMLNANARLQIDQMFAALFLVMILALVLYWLVDKSLRAIVFW